MGISGANALIAESGSVMMLTNEGNGSLVTSLPPVHVVMAGYDKLNCWRYDKLCRHPVTRL
jgi:L-lactate dehydrogenase complex protein LldF